MNFSREGIHFQELRDGKILSLSYQRGGADSSACQEARETRASRTSLNCDATSGGQIAAQELVKGNQAEAYPLGWRDLALRFAEMIPVRRKELETSPLGSLTPKDASTSSTPKEL